MPTESAKTVSITDDEGKEMYRLSLDADDRVKIEPKRVIPPWASLDDLAAAVEKLKS